MSDEIEHHNVVCIPTVLRTFVYFSIDKPLAEIRSFSMDINVHKILQAGLDVALYVYLCMWCCYILIFPNKCT